ncbi:MAG: hypothetical protein DWQ31_13855 [Planctomycetota bacterium]|nr:MAG: hypothetical protein DWQ31_13855 [Planctomycetota bacterium]
MPLEDCAMAKFENRRLAVRWIALLVIGAGLSGFGAAAAYAQPAGGEAPAADAAEGGPDLGDRLLLEQGQLADTYRRFKSELLKLAELIRKEDPDRAALLEKAVSQSSRRGVHEQLTDILDLLDSDLLRDLEEVSSRQAEVEQDLQALLRMLITEDRADESRNERERLRDYIKQLSRFIKTQKEIRTRSQRGGEADRLARRQGKLAERTGDLAGRIKDNEEQAAEDGTDAESASETPGSQEDSEPGQPQSGDPQSGEPQSGEPSDGESEASDAESESSSDGESSEGQSSDGSPSAGDRPESDDQSDASDDADADKDDEAEADSDADDRDSTEADNEGDETESDSAEDSPSGESSPSGEGQSPPSGESPPSGQGQPSPSGQGQPGEPSQGAPADAPQAEPFPARERIEAAAERMREAQEKLEEAQRADAKDLQDEAIAQLEQAKRELEEILRQMREEEREQILAMLEGRFRKMREMQQAVYDATVNLDKEPEEKRDRAFTIEAERLSRKENKIITEVDKAMVLLREDGTSVALPEAVIQLREDMQMVSERLADAKVGKLTQDVESDILEALDEIIAALEKARKDLKEGTPPPPPPGFPAGDPGDPPLVDILAELKMIRALQMRVNRRTEQYKEMIESGEVATGWLIPTLQRLAEREEKIHRVTRDIVLGKNR